MKASLLGVLVATCLVSGPALAQSYVIASESLPYQPLTGDGVTVLNDTSSPAVTIFRGGDLYDEGAVALPIPFDFEFYGQPAGEVLVHSNGVLFFTEDRAHACNGAAFNSRCAPSFPRVVPTGGTGVLHGFLAPWWANLTGGTPGVGNLKYRAGKVMTPEGELDELVLEYENWGYAGAGTTGINFSFQVSLRSDNTMRVHYGTHPKPTTAVGRTVTGVESADGMSGLHLLACNDNCTSDSWPENTRVTISPPIQPDLYVSSVTVSAVDVSASSLSFEVNTALNNAGLTATGDFVWRAYLSTDPQLNLDASQGPVDTQVYQSTSVAVAGQSRVTDFASISVPRPPTGRYYVLVLVDATNTITEFQEGNNTGASTQPFVIGLDLVARSVALDTSANPARSDVGPGDTVTLRAELVNQGTDDPAPVAFRILYSTSTTLGASAVEMFRGQVDLANSDTLVVPANFILPTRLPAGPIYWFLQVDPDGAVADADRSNNLVVSSGGTQVSHPELVVQKVAVVTDDTGAVETSDAYFGQSGYLKVTVLNSGKGNALDYSLGVWVSGNVNASGVVQPDSRLNRFTDTLASTEPVGFHAAGTVLKTGESEEFIFRYTLPLLNRKAKPFVSGRYYLIVEADTGYVLSEQHREDDALPTENPVLIRAPSPDYRATRVDAPDRGSVGEPIPVYRILRNLGNVDGPPVAYRYVASANTIISEQDTPLPILTANGAQEELGLVSLPQGAVDSGIDYVVLPGQLPAGPYYIGIIVDPAGAVDELDERNNTSASGRTVQVLPPSLRIVTTALPDAPAGQPYQYQLSAEGLDSTAVWSLVAGQGELPLGLQLAPDGMISGVPLREEVTAFTARVNSGSKEAAVRLVLRVIPATSELAITTTRVPAFTNGKEQRFQMPASGGIKPYQWTAISVNDNKLPAGLQMDAQGWVWGTPREQFVDGGPKKVTRRVQMEVRDAVGSVARAEVDVTVVVPGSIYIKTPVLDDGRVGAAYAPRELAAGMDEATVALEQPLVWSIISGQLPEGLVLDATTYEGKTVIRGTPTVPGTFTFTLQVMDNLGRADAADFAIRVHAARYGLTLLPEPGVLTAGSTVDLRLASSLPQEDSTLRFHLFSGRLPAGITLQESGALSGTVAADAQVGSYDFIVEATDAQGGTGLGAFTLRVEPTAVAPSGCSTAPGQGGSGLWVGALLLVAALLRARRPAARMAAVATAATLVLMPGLAQAQNVSYQMRRLKSGEANATYQELPSATVPVAQAKDGFRIPMPFPFYFYDYEREVGESQPEAVEAVGVSLHGYLTLDTESTLTKTSNETVADSSTSTMKRFIAPWWDNIVWVESTPSSGVHWVIDGKAPNRVLKVEWRNVALSGSANAASRFTFQVHLEETTNAIRFVYANRGLPPSASATMGLKRDHGAGQAPVATPTGDSPPGCSTAGVCSYTSSTPAASKGFIPGATFEWTMPPDLKLERLAADDFAFAGNPILVSVDVSNRGSRASNARVRYFLSEDAVLDRAVDGSIRERELGTGVQTQAPIGVRETATLNTSLVVPSDLTSNHTYYLFVEVSPSPFGAELRTDNNSNAKGYAVFVNPATPDLEVSAISSPTTQSAPGASMAVQLKLKNTGSASAAGPIRYTYFLSDNETVSIGDVPLEAVCQGAEGCAVGSLDVLAQADLQETVVLPQGLAAGRYWLGACVDYDPTQEVRSTVDEIREVNNCRAATDPLLVLSGELTVLTRYVPGSALNAAYGFDLQAAGGEGSYVWSVKEGSTLPPGLTLSATGLLSGRPLQVGTYTFEVQVQSGSEVAGLPLELQVADSAKPLTIVPQDLLPAVFATAYQSRLYAIGGLPPYEWSLQAGSRLPAGLALSRAGVLEGVATETRVDAFPFVVELEDAAGTRAAASLELRVLQPTSLRIATARLANAVLGETYFQRLLTVGGTSQPTWELVRYQQLPELPTDELQPAIENVVMEGGQQVRLPVEFPADFGLTLRQENDGRWFLGGTPQKAGTYSLTFRAKDLDTPQGRYTTLVLKVTYREGLTLITSALPDAFVGQPYQVKLGTNAPDSTVVTFDLACVQQVDDSLSGSECLAGQSGQTLPAGLTLAADGTLSGTPEAADGLGADGAVHPLLLRAVDAEGRQDVRALSIRLRPAPQQSGCSGTGLGPSALALLALAGLVRRRRG